jgi:general secretion pathway protein H
MGMVAGLVLPHLVRPPGPVELRDSAREIAAILRNDRNTALARRRDVVTSVDVDKGIVRSGVTGRTVRMPSGIKIKLVQSSRELGGSGTGIRFRAGGGSSGGELTLSRQGFAYRISVNWLTASVRVANVGARG